MKEYYDVLDVFRRPTGRVKERGTPLEDGEYRSGAEIWLFHPDGRLMITRRHAAKKHGGKWECTGGMVASGETTMQTIVRETKEEIGVELRPGQVRKIGTKLCGQEYLDIFTAKTDIPVSALKLQPTEVIGARYVFADELREMRDSGEFISHVYRRIAEFGMLPKNTNV